MNGRMRHFSLGVVTIAVLSSAGCSALPSRDAPIGAAATMYNRVELNYRAETSRINVLAAAAHGDARLVSYQTAAPSYLPDGALATVRIRYPHPDKSKPGFAAIRVDLEGSPDGKVTAVEETSLWKRWWQSTREEMPGLKGAGWVHETWTVDLPRDELDRLVAGLRRDDFFGERSASAPSSHLLAEVDGLSRRKDWNQLPELDAVLLRVRGEGKLTTSTGPAKGTAESPTAKSYRDMLTRMTKSKEATARSRPVTPAPATPAAVAQTPPAPASAVR